jgi:nicotinate-nucleotide pyrophosphorylase (carboxylating)
MTSFTPTPALDALLDLALTEDVGTGDVTTDATVPRDLQGVAHVEARQRLVVCGAPVVDRLLTRWGAAAPVIEWLARDGDVVEKGTLVARLHGRFAAILTLERTLLNLMQRMSGVATVTRAYVDAVAGTRARIVDTRKTLPGWRLLDKYAVRVGGGVNHRAALDGGLLIKDNHLAVAGGVGPAVEAAKRAAPHVLRIEVEVEDLAGLDAALAAGADVVLLDNFTPDGIRQAVERAAGRALLEASGGITLANVRAFAEAGVDVISVGALTHSAPAADLAIEIARAP